ncbi:nitroreductase family protein [Sagittula salina]|uniref:Putative NAD(P)H nitroreductase n=1 Tax=Sagittula salina TaxID=2820268 RepID=A0A940MJ42_9RHOB|nr:nitroreductase [Sagittula salina]MBP0482441.1 nitroreductase [Sagittula salina]
MPSPNPAAMDFLLTRRSRPSKTLTGPAPDRETLETLLTAAARSPDHGKLEPWRFVVLQGAALERMAAAVEVAGQRLGKDEDAVAKAAAAFRDSPLCVAVIEVQKPSEKIPAIEQTYSAGAVCLALLNAALASGWGANWLSGWASHDRQFLTDALSLSDTESLAGFIHIGTETSTPPDRPRPDLSKITTWVEA